MRPYDIEETAISAEVNDLPSDFLQKDVCDKLVKILPYQIDTKDVETAYKHINMSRKEPYDKTMVLPDYLDIV